MKLAVRRPRSSTLGALGAELSIMIGAGCAGGQRPGALPVAVAGCYRLTLWPDEPGPDGDEKRAAWRVPTMIRLDTAILTAWPSLTGRFGDSVYQAGGFWEGRWREQPFNFWRPYSGDSIYVGHPGALAGVSLVLDIRGETLRGVMTAHTDTPITDRARRARLSAPVEARRVPCPDSG
jgi:hypothetical protein